MVDGGGGGVRGCLWVRVVRAKDVRLAELKGAPVLIPLRWLCLFVADCRRLGFEPDVLCVSDSIVQDLLLAKMGVGAAILPVSSRTLLTDGNLLCKRLIEPEMSTHTVVAWLKNRTLSSSAAHLIKLFREIYLKQQD